MHRFRKKSDAKRVPLPEAYTQAIPSTPPKSAQYNSASSPHLPVFSARPSLPLLNSSPASNSRPSPAPRSAPLLTSTPILSPIEPTTQSLPGIEPVTDDFRSSIILTDLSRRFSLLRTSSGNPVSPNDMRFRFQKQRQNGGKNTITEEEEDLVVDALNQFRQESVHPVASGSPSSGRHYQGGDESMTDSGYIPSSSDMLSIRTKKSSTSSTGQTSVTDSLNSRQGRRHSNHLFSSGRFRDQSYMRTAMLKTTRSRGQLSTTSETSTEVQPADGPRSTSPEHSRSFFDSVDGSSPDFENRMISSVRSAPLAAPYPFEAPNLTPSEKRSSNNLSPTALKRLSAAFQEVLREIEEETEDEIVLPRSTPPARLQALRDAPARQNEHTISFPPGSSSPNVEPVERGLAVSPDNSREPYARSSTVSPTPRVPGYIPGMPRPRTPRNIELSEHRPDSTTPRPASPGLSRVSSDGPTIISPRFRPGALRMTLPGSTAPEPQLQHVTPAVISLVPERPKTPGVAERRQRTAGQGSLDSSQSTDVSILSRETPTSSISVANAFASGSRPGTPSNVTWTSRPNSPKASSNGSHTRGGGASDAYNSGFGGPAPSRPSDYPTDRDTSESPSWPQDPQSCVAPVIQDAQPLFDNHSELQSPTPTRNFQSATDENHSNDKERDTHTLGAAVASPLSLSSMTPFSPPPTTNHIMSPIANSSRSSLVSTGSSYHSDVDPMERSRVFLDAESSKPVWHDLSRSTSQTQVDMPDDPEEVMRALTGLTKMDFVVIQEKLVNAAKVRLSDEEARERAPSLRRRRPSTAHSVNSINARDLARDLRSPSPAAVAPLQISSSGFGRTTSSQIRLKELQSSDAKIASPVDLALSRLSDEKEMLVPPTEPVGTSSPARRRRDLVDAMFGPESSFTLTDGSETFVPDFETTQPYLTFDDQYVEPPMDPKGLVDASVERPQGWTTLVSGQGQLSMTSPTTPTADHAELEKEVQRKAEAAMVALHRSPLEQGYPEPSTPTQKRKIKAHTISTPRLMSATASLETIPLPFQPGRGASSKLGDRFKLKLKRGSGSVRSSRPTTPNTESTLLTASPTGTPASSSHTLGSPPASQTVLYPGYLSIPRASGAVSATEAGSFKISNPYLPSPPASAAPGIRGFMSRFRKARPADLSTENDRASLYAQQSNPSRSGAISYSMSPRPSPPERERINAHRVSFDDPSQAEASKRQSSDVALKQFFDAAKDLGVDHEALNEFLSRSNSKSSHTTVGSRAQSFKRNTSLTKSYRPLGSTVLDGRVQSLVPEGRTSLETHPTLSTDQVQRASSMRRLLEPHLPLRPRQQDKSAQDPAQTIIRRTLVFPSDFKPSASSTDLPGLASRKNSVKRRSAGTTSSSKSVHDRAPTPPPPRHPVFISEPSPPVPFAQAKPFSGPRDPTVVIDDDYDPYAQDPTITRRSHKRISESSLSPTEAPATDVSALEVIEYANGETIWNVVNSLRDEDVESIYPSASRASISSEYSMPRENSDGIQLFFKEHKKSMSKESNSSASSRRRRSPTPAATALRPETKVFYSSSNQIARLIENISRGMDSGSFNILPSGDVSDQLRVQGDVHWTVEERLEHMLGSLESTGAP